MDANLVEQRHMEICQWSRLVIFDVTGSLHLSSSAACNDNRQPGMVVAVGIAHAASVEIKRMVEQRAVSFGRGLQLVQEVGE